MGVQGEAVPATLFTQFEGRTVTPNEEYACIQVTCSLKTRDYAFLRLSGVQLCGFFEGGSAGEDDSGCNFCRESCVVCLVLTYIDPLHLFI